MTARSADIARAIVAHGIGVKFDGARLPVTTHEYEEEADQRLLQLCEADRCIADLREMYAAIQRRCDGWQLVALISWFAALAIFSLSGGRG